MSTVTASLTATAGARETTTWSSALGTIQSAGNRIAQPAERLITSVQFCNEPRGYSVTPMRKSRGNEYQWRIYRGKEQVERVRWRKLTKKTCKRNIPLQEGAYRFKLESGREHRMSTSMDQSRRHRLPVRYPR